MEFQVLAAGTKPPDGAKSCAFLVADNADDWGKFTTQFTLIICDVVGNAHMIGEVKIGQFGWEAGQMKPTIPESFEKLEAQFFSLGQDDSYYENLKARKSTTRQTVLEALRDIAADKKLYAKAIKEDVTNQSLLRLVTGVTAQHQFRRLAAVDERREYDAVMEHFHEQLGGEARAVARALLALSKDEDE